ncbi:MAG: prohibitin family protein [Armatimonadota bacterium]
MSTYNGFPGKVKFSNRTPAQVISVVVVIVVIMILHASVVIVPAGYRGVLLRFGAVTGVLNEGMNIIVPFISSAEMIEVRTQKEQSSASAASRDMQTVQTTVAINFHLIPSKVGDLYKNVGIDYRVRIIDPAVQESLKQVTAKYSAEQLVTRRSEVKMQVEHEITMRLGKYDILVEPLGVSITDFSFSPEFNAAIEQKQVAQQETEKQKYVLEKADLERQTAVMKAKGEAESVKIKALALQAAGGNKVLAREWIDKWDGHLPTVSGGNSSYIMDLKSFMQDKPGK